VSCAYELQGIKDPNAQLELAELAADRKLNVKNIRHATKLLKRKDSLTDSFFGSTLNGPVGTDPESDSVRQATITLRVCLIRLDTLLQTMRESNTKQMLHAVRFEIHTLIDRTIRLEKEDRLATVHQEKI